MAANAVMSDQAANGASGTETVRSDRTLRIVFAAVAAILVMSAWKLPIWQASLSAPQYPQGLKLSASASGVTGDIREINELNHYVGMQAYSNADAWEMALWLPAILLGLTGVALGSLLAKASWIGRLARLGLWLIPVGALLDVQWRLYQYGHSVQPDAPIRLDPFTPLVVGPTHVLNFTTWAYPGPALWALFLAAYLVTFGPWTVRYTQRRWNERARYDDYDDEDD